MFPLEVASEVQDLPDAQGNESRDGQNGEPPNALVGRLVRITHARLSSLQIR